MVYLKLRGRKKSLEGRTLESYRSDMAKVQKTLFLATIFY